jgi:Anti-sigma factor NepR
MFASVQRGWLHSSWLAQTLEKQLRARRSGVTSLSFPDDKGGQRRRKLRPRRRTPATEVGEALRSVYDRALAEDIPPEMLDLLGKLG